MQTNEEPPEVRTLLLAQPALRPRVSRARVRTTTQSCHHILISPKLNVHLYVLPKKMISREAMMPGDLTSLLDSPNVGVACL